MEKLYDLADGRQLTAVGILAAAVADRQTLALWMVKNIKNFEGVHDQMLAIQQDLFSALFPDGTVTAREVAQKLGVSQQRVYQFIREGRLPATRVGGVYRIQESDLEKFELRPTGKPRSKW